MLGGKDAIDRPPESSLWTVVSPLLGIVVGVAVARILQTHRTIRCLPTRICPAGWIPRCGDCGQKFWVFQRKVVVPSSDCVDLLFFCHNGLRLQQFSRSWVKFRVLWVQPITTTKHILVHGAHLRWSCWTVRSRHKLSKFDLCATAFHFLWHHLLYWENRWLTAPLKFSISNWDIRAQHKTAGGASNKTSIFSVRSNW